MKKDVKTLTAHEVQKLMKKHNISSIHSMMQGMGGYNAPYGIGFIHSKNNYLAPLFYFRKPKRVSREDYMDFLALFKYAFNQ